MVTDKLINEVESKFKELVEDAIDFGIALREFSRKNHTPEEWSKMGEKECTILKRIKDNIDVLRQALAMERTERTAFEADSYRSG